MTLLHFDPAKPHLFHLLAVPDLALCVIDTAGKFLVAAKRPHFTRPTREHIRAAIDTYNELSGPPADPDPSVRRQFAELPEWMYFTDTAGKNHFILHTRSPVFLCPFKREGENCHILPPLADQPAIPENRMDDWLDKAATAAGCAFARLAHHLGVEH